MVAQTTPIIESHPIENVNTSLIFSFLENLAGDIDRMHSKGLYHGDIHPKNILFDGKKLVLIDFEPYLQLSDKKGTRQFNITPPWISHDDYKKKKLTFRTDRIGFFHSAYVLINRHRPALKALEMLKKRKIYDYPIWDMISDAAVYRKNCKNILKGLIDKKDRM